MRHQKSALFGSEIRIKMSHSIICTNHHKTDIITTVLLLQSGGAQYIHTRENNGISYASQTPNIQLCLLVQQTGSIADDIL